jgi:hypothetical protein
MVVGVVALQVCHQEGGMEDGGAAIRRGRGDAIRPNDGLSALFPFRLKRVNVGWAWRLFPRCTTLSVLPVLLVGAATPHLLEKGVVP